MDLFIDDLKSLSGLEEHLRFKITPKEDEVDLTKIRIVVL